MNLVLVSCPSLLSFDIFFLKNGPPASMISLETFETVLNAIIYKHCSLSPDQPILLLLRFAYEPDFNDSRGRQLSKRRYVRPAPASRRTVLTAANKFSMQRN